MRNKQTNLMASENITVDFQKRHKTTSKKIFG